MYNRHFLTFLDQELQQVRASGLYKVEREFESPQHSQILSSNRQVINLCANNYLGLANHPALITAAKETLDRRGFGLSSVRFICGTQDIHKELERGLSSFLGTDDTILYSSCFDANGGVFEALLGAEDAIISDALNHASIIDGIRLSKAKRYRYRNNDMEDLRLQLEAAKECRFKLIVTDGVFSMDGTFAKLPEICALADRYETLVMVDDSHAVGFIGQKGRGTPEELGVEGRIDILSGTLGKALGGASGGYISGHRAIIEWLRQRSRPYLFSNSVAPSIVGASLEVLKILQASDELRERLKHNASFFRKLLIEQGFTLCPGSHPIIPVMLGDATLAGKMAQLLLEEGVFVVGFSYPVVPMGQARIRTQVSAAHTENELSRAAQAFKKVGKALGLY